MEVLGNLVGGGHGGRDRKESQRSGCLPYNCDKILGRSNLREEGFLLAHSQRVQSIMEGKAWQQEREAAGHSREAERDGGYGLSPFLLCLQSGT